MPDTIKNVKFLAPTPLRPPDGSRCEHWERARWHAFWRSTCPTATIMVRPSMTQIFLRISINYQLTVRTIRGMTKVWLASVAKSRDQRQHHQLQHYISNHVTHAGEAIRSNGKSQETYRRLRKNERREMKRCIGICVPRMGRNADPYISRRSFLLADTANDETTTDFI